MILKRFIGLAVSCALVSSPAFAADLVGAGDGGTHRSGAFAGAYVRLPFAGLGQRTGPQTGLRLSMVHDFRTMSGREARQFSADALDLRFGAERPALHVAGTAVTGPEATKLKALGTGETIALVVGGVILVVLVGRELLGDALSGD